MSSQVNGWSLLVQGDTAAALAIIERMPTCVHVNGWAYVGGKRKGIVAHNQHSPSTNLSHGPVDSFSQSGSPAASPRDGVSFAIGSNGAVAAPLLFYAIALRQVLVVRHLLRLGSSATLSIKGGLTPLSLATYFASRDGPACDVSTVSDQAKTRSPTVSHIDHSTNRSNSHASGAAAAILALVERYVERAAKPFTALEEDEEEGRSLMITREEDRLRKEIEHKRNSGMVRIICEVRDEIGGYATGNTAKSDQNKVAGMDITVNAHGREEYSFLFPRHASYHTLRARIETALGCRVGIAFDKLSTERLLAAHQDLTGSGIGGASRGASVANTPQQQTLNLTMNSTMSASSQSKQARPSASSISQVRPTTTATLNTSESYSRLSSPQAQMATELNPANFRYFIAQAEQLLALREQEQLSNVHRPFVGSDEVDDEEETFYTPSIRCIVRPVPYSAAGNEADASHYALQKNKTRISKDLKAYEQLPANERDLSRVQALKKQLDDEEREIHTKQNYFQFQAKKLSPEAIEAATKRLYEYPVAKLRERYEAFDGEVEEQMEKLIRSRRPGELSAEQQESVDRLFGAAAEKEDRIAQLDEDHWSSIPQPQASTLEEDEAATCRERLTTDTRVLKRTALDQTIYGEQEAKWKRRLTKEEMAKSVQSCYTAPKERHAKTMAELETKYGDWMLRKKQFKAQPVKKYGK